MDDIISRQAVLDYIDKMPSELNQYGNRMIRRIRLTEYIADSLPSVQPEPFINKPCVSEQACHEDKMQVLKKIRKEIEENRDEWLKGQDPEWHAYDRCIAIIDKYIAESEDKE